MGGPAGGGGSGACLAGGFFWAGRTGGGGGGGEGGVWPVHGGASYQAVKHGHPGERLPRILHWFYWEASPPCLSGMGLLLVVYWPDARAYMAGPLAPGTAVAVAVGAI